MTAPSMLASMLRGAGFCVSALIALNACAPNNLPADGAADADASDDAAQSDAQRALSAPPNAVSARDLTQVAGRVDVSPITCVRRSDGPPYTCSPCMPGAACDLGVPCRVGRVSRCIVDSPVCDDTGPAPNGSACGTMGSGMVCNAGSCGCPAGQQNCGGVCRIAGVCSVGTGGCAVTGTWTCNGTNVGCSATAAPPQVETCNGIDDNCDGVIDNITSAACQPALCQTGASYCAAGVLACARTGNSPAGSSCTGIGGGVCDGIGNCVCPAGQTNCGGICRPTGSGCAVGVGACQRFGTVVCSGTSTVCSASAGSPTAEVCNGIDDNCDGTVDNIAASACAPNACQTGVLTCSGASTVCVATANRAAGTSCPAPVNGTCNGAGTCVCPAGTGDCGGICTAGLGNSCTVGTGVCQRTGSLVCTGAGSVGCNVSAGAPSMSPETNCTNGLDDDCDGLTDLADPNCPRGPANDRCASATPVTLSAGSPAYFSGTTVGAAHDTDGTCGAATSAGDVFYRFTITERSLVYADAFGSGYDVVLFFTPGCGSAQPGGWACNDDSCGTLQSQIVQLLDPGTYYLVVSGFSGGAGAFNVQMQTVPASDRVFGIGSGTSTYSGNTSGLSDRTNPGCGYSAAPDETWYHTSCPGYGGGGMFATTCGRAGWDTMLAFRQGNGGLGACVDDSCGLQSQISAGVNAGPGIRAVYVDGYSSANGAYSVYITMP